MIGGYLDQSFLIVRKQRQLKVGRFLMMFGKRGFYHMDYGGVLSNVKMTG